MGVALSTSGPRGRSSFRRPGPQPALETVPAVEAVPAVPAVEAVPALEARPAPEGVLGLAVTA